MYLGRKNIETKPNCLYELATFLKYHMPLGGLCRSETRIQRSITFMPHKIYNSEPNYFKFLPCFWNILRATPSINLVPFEPLEKKIF